ncbi:tropomyosin isoform X8 [Gigantopelta aegis]|uniref:tropomyosin isoform X8 n=1 Tax=Gigantopelta aegis TaxID=1735272 RepID=UPI001B88BC76|nr:tropomyosin isoform X8 [Gigantopelta aegis]
MGDNLLAVDEPEYAASTELSQDSNASSHDLSQGSSCAYVLETLPSSGTKTKKKKGTKKKKKKEKSSKERNEDGEDSSKTRTSRASANRRNSSSRRPEPEGGNSPVSFSVEEYDRIIYSDAPLFPDVEITADDLISNEGRRSRTQRLSRDGVVMIPCAQLGITSNTMIKFAIIGTELHNVVQVALKRMETEINGMNRRVQLLEEDMERNEERLQTATERLEEASKAADESERGRRMLEGKLTVTEDRLDQLESQLKQAQMVAQEAETKYEEVARKLTVTEAELERQEERAEDLLKKYKHYEDECCSLTSSLKSLEVNEVKASQREDSYEETIRDLTQRLKDKEIRLENAEREISLLQLENDKLHEELQEQRERNRSLQLDMEQTLSDLQNL